MEDSDRQERAEQPATDPAAPEESPRGQAAPENDKSSLEEVLKQAPLDGKEALRGEYAPGSIYNVYHIYQGNFVNNSGTIQGDVSQSHTGEETRPDAATKPLAGTLGDIRNYFQGDRTSEELAAVMTLAELGPVPESRFFEIAHQIDLEQLGRQPADGVSNVTLQMRSVEELAAPFQICRGSLPVSYGPEMQEVWCLTFEQEGLNEQIQRFLWETYPQLRPILIKWLVKQYKSKGDNIDHALACRAVAALAKHAAMDAGYAFRDLIPKLEQDCTVQSDVKYMTEFIMELMKYEPCQASVDVLLCRWCDRGGYLWQIPYRLYGVKGKTGAWRFRDKLPRVLADHLRRDIAGAGRNYLAWYQYDRGYLLSPARRNSEAAALFAGQLASQYEMCRNNGEQYLLAVYFLSLFRWDYLTDFSAEPELVFLRCFHDKELRRRLLPLIQFAWQRPELRGVMGGVLSNHFAEISRHGMSWEYLKKPFVYLAFTGRGYDYKITCALLNECSLMEEVAPVSRALMKYLEEELQQRRVRSNLLGGRKTI